MYTNNSLKSIKLLCFLKGNFVDLKKFMVPKWVVERTANYGTMFHQNNNEAVELNNYF